MRLKHFLKKSKLLVQTIRFIRKISNKYKGVNWVKSLYINFKTQKGSHAIKLPILIYGKVTIGSLSGKIVIRPPISHAMIRLGANSDFFSSSKRCALLNIRGTLMFHGLFFSSVDYTIDVLGTLEFSDCCVLGNGVKIRCWDKITIGEGTRIALESQIFDTDFHYVRDITTGMVKRNSSPVTIGRYCWIGNRSTIMKGTKIPDYTIVAGNSLCNRDFSEAPQCSFIAGCPAKIRGEGGIVRIFNNSTEQSISEYFNSNPASTHFQGDIGIINELESIHAALR